MIWAVHISDYVLQPSWVVAGWMGAALLAALGAWRLRDEDIPRVALLTAAFFVASSIPVPVGPVHAHLLFNGLVGVMLGRRAGLAILVGLLLQAALIGHGAYTTIGVTACVTTLPAWAAWAGFRGLRRLSKGGVGTATETAANHVQKDGVSRHVAAAPRRLLVAVSALIWTLSLVYCIAWIRVNGISSQEIDLVEPARITFQPLTLIAALALSLAAVRLEARLENLPEFPLGLLLGELTVLATVVLNSAVLILGGERDWRLWAVLQLVAHLPVALLEGVVLGFVVGYLARVKPEMLG